MMSKSFQEDRRSGKSSHIMRSLKEAKQNLKEWRKPAFLDEETEDFCLKGLEWIEVRDKIWEQHFTPCFGKLLQPGRVVLICHERHRSKLGVYVKTEQDKLNVLVLSNADEAAPEKLVSVF